MISAFKFFLTSTFLIFSLLGIAQQNSKPITIGKADLLHSVILNEDRILNIYLPEDYHQHDTIHYPVIYVLDGGIEEDFLHITGIVRYSTQPWVARFPRSIVVGIEGNTRRRDFTFPVANTDFLIKEGIEKSAFLQYGGSEKYSDFIEKELQPYIERTYHAGGKRTVIGESLAGLYTAELLLKRPHLFDDYFVISPSLWWGDRLLLEQAERLMAKNLTQRVNVYIGVPAREEDVRMYTVATALYDHLKDNKKVHVVFDYLPEELHSTVIHQAVYNGFKRLYPKTMYSK